MPACLRLLQTLILPQKESRRSVIVILPEISGSAWIKIGTLSPQRLIVSATPLSSPKFGSVTIMPSIFSAFLVNRAAHFLASAKVSTAPYFVSCIDSATALNPFFLRTSSIALRPDLARWSGKKPLLPTITPNVVFFILFLYLFLSIISVFTVFTQVVFVQKYFVNLTLVRIYIYSSQGRCCYQFEHASGFDGISRGFAPGERAMGGY